MIPLEVKKAMMDGCTDPLEKLKWAILYLMHMDNVFSNEIAYLVTLQQRSDADGD